jgi:hypothetical protein
MCDFGTPASTSSGAMPSSVLSLSIHTLPPKISGPASCATEIAHLFPKHRYTGKKFNAKSTNPANRHAQMKNGKTAFHLGLQSQVFRK